MWGRRRQVIEQPGVPAGSFDAVSSSSSLHHLEDLPRCMAEMLRVLKPGGHLIIRETHGDTMAPAQLTDVYLHRWAAEIDSALGSTHNPVFARRESWFWWKTWAWATSPGMTSPTRIWIRWTKQPSGTVKKRSIDTCGTRKAFRATRRSKRGGRICGGCARWGLSGNRSSSSSAGSRSWASRMPRGGYGRPLWYNGR